MGHVITEVSPIAIQVSGNDPSSRPILSVLVKRTYTLTSNGPTELAHEQVPLVLEPHFHPKHIDLLLQDTDILPYKPLSDVVIKGHVYGYSGSTRFEAGVRVEKHAKRLLVIGDRRQLGPTGLIFSRNSETRRCQSLCKQMKADDPPVKRGLTMSQSQARMVVPFFILKTIQEEPGIMPTTNFFMAVCGAIPDCLSRIGS
jgi:hypothetical protein